MTLPPTSLFARLLLAAVAALAVLAAAAVWLAPPGVGAAATAAVGPTEPPAPLRLPPGLRPVGQAWLFGPGRQPPPLLAPVVELMPSGAVMLRRAAPVPLAPDVGVGSAAILLPAAQLAVLSPEQRAALLDLLGVLIPGRPVPPTALQLQGIDASATTVARLCAWVR